MPVGSYIGASSHWSHFTRAYAPQADVTVLSAYGGIRAGGWHSRLEVSEACDGFADASFVASEDVTMAGVTLGVLGSGGRADPERPYLAESPRAPFRSVGDPSRSEFGAAATLRVYQLAPGGGLFRALDQRRGELGLLS